MNSIITPNTTELLFEVHITELGSYIAVREQEPLFCFEGPTINSVVEAAQRTFDSYQKLKG